MFHNNSSFEPANETSEPELLQIDPDSHSPTQTIDSTTNFKTPPRLRASSWQNGTNSISSTVSIGRMPPNISLTDHIADAPFEGEAEQNYQNFLNFLISKQSEFYNKLTQRTLSAEFKADDADNDEVLNSLFEHNFNLNMLVPHYAGGVDDNDPANLCAKEFLNYFWHREDNLNLTRQRHAFNKEQHAAGLTEINIQLIKIIKLFCRDSPWRKNLIKYYNLVKNSQQINLQTFNHNSETAWSTIKSVVAEIPNSFHDLEDLTSRLDIIYKIVSKLFSTDQSNLNRGEIITDLAKIYELSATLVKYLRKKNQKLEAVIKESFENLNASCLSFVTAKTVLDNNHCYVSISSPQHNEALLAALRDSVDHYNSTESSRAFGYKFHVITEPASQNSQLLLQKIIAFTKSPHPIDPFKHCAEKSYITMLAKLSYEKNITITSICNVNFLPLMEAEVSRMKSFTGTKLVSMQIQNHIISYCVIPACKNCKINKIGALIYIGAAKEYRAYVSQKIRDEQTSLQLTSTNIGLFTPERKIKEVTSFVSPLTGLYPGHNTPSPPQIKNKEQKEIKSSRLSFPSLSGMGN